jgi:hypothetical protein
MTDLTIYRGDTVKLNVAVTAGGAVFNLTGCTVWFTVKNQYSDPDNQSVFQKSTTNGGITITDAPNGLCQVTIANADTSGEPDTKVMLLWDCQVKDASGNIYTVNSGNLIILPDVTKTT